MGAEIRSVQQQSWWAEYPEEPAVKLWWHPVGRLRMASLRRAVKREVVNGGR